MKARELKELKSSNPQDLTTKLGDLKAELFNLRFQLATGQLENPMRIREVTFCLMFPNSACIAFLNFNFSPPRHSAKYIHTQFLICLYNKR